MGRNQVVLRNPRKNRIVVLEELNFVWDEPELEEIAELWTQGFSIMYISNKFERDPDEVILALVHLGRTDRITRRKGGFLLGL
ncbi:hypothetical protein KHA94_16410 [Bacillus sp. FJAT-49705]|uniref:Uncharacterized protein n=1 Tax=Cytobacillus citreus TaxID=2833586 RepID=A0ABS5NWF5_9BACI|nr:hypothetical protein [Cytobacillus citreus]MBS4191774.1 hypothetical protein [Cytobacillus citreus]